MLAYVFWHWKRTEIPGDVYEARQRAFQATLVSDPPEGFQGGTTIRLDGALWAAAGGEAYEDWYLVRDFAALPALNEAAVTAARQAPHDAVARLAAGGTAGLYGLRAGAPLPLPGVAYWFGKPAGMSYPALFQALLPIVTESRGALWMRQMVLGPAPEFCLQFQGPAMVELPAAFASQRVTLTSIWPRP